MDDKNTTKIVLKFDLQCTVYLTFYKQFQIVWDYNCETMIKIIFQDRLSCYCLFPNLCWHLYANSLKYLKFNILNFQ